MSGRTQPKSGSLALRMCRKSQEDLKARIQELEAALRPFAAIAKELTGAMDDDDKNDMRWAIPTVGQLRSALAALQPKSAK